MGGLLDRLEPRDGETVVTSSGVTVGEVERALEAGQSLDQVGASLSIGAADLIAAVGAIGLGPDGSEGPSLIQTRPSRPYLSDAVSEPALAKLLPGSTRAQRLALAAGLLQIHDVWDASHQAAQQADDQGESHVSAYWHGIAHRREPDPGNASYWFRRVGRHGLFRPLAEAARPWIEAQGGSSPADRILASGSWDPFAFIAFCGSARPGSAEDVLARRLQRLEMALLLDATARAVGI